MGQDLAYQALIDCALVCQCSVAVKVERSLRVVADRGIDKHITRASIKGVGPGWTLTRREKGYVADAADVLQGKCLLRVAKEQGIEERGQGRSLPASGNIGHAHVGHDAYPQALRDHRRLAGLPG